jgi:hypothetical protein
MSSFQFNNIEQEMKSIIDSKIPIYKYIQQCQLNTKEILKKTLIFQ